jgi:sarcosine oxidase subunit gamma
MNQNPGTDVTPRSALHFSQSAEQPVFGPGQARVFLWEDALQGQFILRGDAGTKAFADGIETALGLVLPDRLSSSVSDQLALMWLSPDEWLLLCALDQTFAIETRLRDVLSGHYSIINVSGGQTQIRLSGSSATEVLQKSIPYDVSDRQFPVGKVVSTALAKTQATVRRISDTDWELTVRRSFADYAWRWLTDASREYGLHLGPPNHNES